MLSSPSTRSDGIGLPSGVQVVGSGLTSAELAHRLRPWRIASQPIDLLLVLAGTRTAERPGISAAGATAASRRITALADAELLLRGPAMQRRWSLPPLPAGVSPALLSQVVVKALQLHPQVAAVGLPLPPDFPHLRLEGAGEGPAACLSSGQAMDPQRVLRLWQQGEALGRRLRHPLLLAECVPGGTSTALAVLQAFGVEVSSLVSGSARQPPQSLKRQLVIQGLRCAHLSSPPSAQAVLAAVGDPFQAVAAGLLCGTLSSGCPVLLGGGSQMVAVIALAFAALNPSQRDRLVHQILVGTTAWLAQEVEERSEVPSMLGRLIDVVSEHWGVRLPVLASGVRFHGSRHRCLRDYERGFVKEGVGAGALLLLAQCRGFTVEDLVQRCDGAVDALLQAPVGSAS